MEVHLFKGNNFHLVLEITAAMRAVNDLEVPRACLITCGKLCSIRKLEEC